MNNITNSNEPKLKNPVDFLTTCCGIIQCEKEDQLIFRHIDLLAITCWERNHEVLSGWEYFAQIADSCGLDFIAGNEYKDFLN